MIQLTRIDGTVFFMNIEAIAVIEETPGTIVRMRDGEVVRVLETAAVVLVRVQSAQSEVIAVGIAIAIRQLST